MHHSSWTSAFASVQTFLYQEAMGSSGLQISTSASSNTSFFHNSGATIFEWTNGRTSDQMLKSRVDFLPNSPTVLCKLGNNCHRRLQSQLRRLPFSLLPLSSLHPQRYSDVFFSDRTIGHQKLLELFQDHATMVFQEIEDHWANLNDDDHYWTSIKSTSMIVAYKSIIIWQLAMFISEMGIIPTILSLSKRWINIRWISIVPSFVKLLSRKQVNAQ